MLLELHTIRRNQYAPLSKNSREQRLPGEPFPPVSLVSRLLCLRLTQGRSPAAYSCSPNILTSQKFLTSSFSFVSVDTGDHNLNTARVQEHCRSYKSIAFWYGISPYVWRRYVCRPIPVSEARMLLILSSRTGLNKVLEQPAPNAGMKSASRCLMMYSYRPHILSSVRYLHAVLPFLKIMTNQPACFN